MVVLARPIITGALDYGNFTAASVTTTAGTLAWFGVGLFAFSAYLYTVRGMYAQLDTRTPFLVNLLENALNIGLAVALYPHLGVRGLAISWSVAYSVAAIVAWVVLDRRVGGLEGPRTLGVFARVLVATALGAATAWGVDRLIDPATAPAAILTVVVGGLAGLAVAVGGAAALGVPEITELRTTLTRSPRPGGMTSG